MSHFGHVPAHDQHMTGTRRISTIRLILWFGARRRIDICLEYDRSFSSSSTKTETFFCSMNWRWCPSSTYIWAGHCFKGVVFNWRTDDTTRQMSGQPNAGKYMKPHSATPSDCLKTQNGRDWPIKWRKFSHSSWPEGPLSRTFTITSTTVASSSTYGVKIRVKIQQTVCCQRSDGEGATNRVGGVITGDQARTNRGRTSVAACKLIAIEPRFLCETEKQETKKIFMRALGNEENRKWHATANKLTESS
jgi:hypothetical protein